MLSYLLLGFSYHQNLMTLNLHLLTLITLLLSRRKFLELPPKSAPQTKKLVFSKPNSLYLHFQAYFCWGPPPPLPTHILLFSITAQPISQGRNLFFDSPSSKISINYQVFWRGKSLFWDKFTYHTIHPFTVHNSVVFSIFTKLCYHHHDLIPPSQRKPSGGR